MTADEQYTRNMQFLARHPSEAIRQMPLQLAALPLSNVHLMPNARGQVCGAAWSVTEQQWVGLCETDDPLAQAERTANAVYTSQVRVLTICGMGLGYAAAAIARRLKPYQRLSIWELSPSLYKAMFYCLDATPLFTDKRVHFFIGPDAATHIEEHWLTLDVQEKLAIAMPLVGEYALHVDKTAYEHLLERTADMLRHHMVGLSTWKMFGKEIGDNDLTNMPEYFTTPGYEHLDGLWHDRPAVCVAAGPSLQHNLRQLLDPGIRERVALITAGTTYALVHGLHLEPDVVTTIDFQRLNWTDQFAGVPLDNACPLVYLHSTYPQTIRRWPGPKFVAENGSDTVQWFRGFGEGKRTAAQVQTVAHLNVLVALTLGANPILLLGQDLSMPRDAHHAMGARAQDQTPDETPAEAFIEMADYQGRPVWTRHSFLSMKTVFERLAAEHPGRLINCSEGGLALAGIPNLPLREALARCPAPAGLPTHAMLRREAQRVWQGYTPTIPPTLLPALVELQRGVEVLAQEWAPAVLRWQAVRERWQGRDPEEDPAHDGLGDAAQGHLLALEPQLAAHQAALSLFLIREFRMIEVMADLPAGDAWMTDLGLQHRYTADRLARTAELLLGVAAQVRQAFRDTIRRLKDVVPSEQSPGWMGPQVSCVSTIARLIRHQHYGIAWRVLWDMQSTEQGAWDPSMTPAAWMRLIGHSLYHTQQYAAALAVLKPQGLARGFCARMERHMAQFATDMRAALPAYFAQGPIVVVKESAAVHSQLVDDTYLPGLWPHGHMVPTGESHLVNGAAMEITQPIGVPH